MITKENSADALDAIDRYHKKQLERDRAIDHALAGLRLDNTLTGIALQAIVSELREQRHALAVLHLQTCQLGTACSDYDHARLAAIGGAR